MVEMVVGLTDRVVRSYRWYSINTTENPAPHMPDTSKSDADKLPGTCSLLFIVMFSIVIFQNWYIFTINKLYI